MVDYELTKKFARNLHLNVPDRKALRGGKIRGSVLAQAIADIIEESAKYPESWNIRDAFDGGLIEKIEGSRFRLTWKAETGVSRYEVMSVAEFTDASAAAKGLVQKFFKSSFDGIPIDWSE
jgi:hypothetical protein